MNGGSEYVPAMSGTLANPGPTENRYRYDEETREFQWWGNGIAGINKSFNRKEIINGSSTTVALEEIRAGIDPLDSRGVWALGQIGGSITWGHGMVGDDGGPNSSQKDNGSDDIYGAPKLYEKLGREVIAAEKMGACDYCDENAQATARSKHPGGVNVLMLDGSVKFVSDAIEITLWHVMHSREAPEDTFDLDVIEQELAASYQPGEASPELLPHSKNRPLESQEERTLENSIGMQFVLVPAGEFEMGIPNKANRFPFPKDLVAHKVNITNPYYLGIHEVTQSEYEQIMGSNPSAHAVSGLYQDRVTVAETSKCPVESVSWDDAVEFCNRLSDLPKEKAAGRVYRLPTEAEWERASRGGRTQAIELVTSWSEGLETGEIACKKFELDSPLTTVPVGSYPPNSYGLYDMCGNVWEWVSDYQRYGYYINSPTADPQGPETGYLRVIRGWHWAATGPLCKVYMVNDPWSGSPFVGFRVICDRKTR
ncbi:MAG: SUMF1/EgtB/PvdO family nonheme iron enzyme [Planctomycetaceae bacterium]